MAMVSSRLLSVKWRNHAFCNNIIFYKECLAYRIYLWKNACQDFPEKIIDGMVGNKHHYFFPGPASKMILIQVAFCFLIHIFFNGIIQDDSRKLNSTSGNHTGHLMFKK